MCFKKQDRELLNYIFNSDEWRELPLMLSVKQTAEFINVSEAFIYNRIRNKIFPAKIVAGNKNNSYKILKPTLEAYIKRSLL